MIRSKLHIGMALSPTWLSGEAWRRPDSGIEGLFGAGFYTDIAQRAEAAALDFVFLPDVQMVNRAGLGGGTGFASLDPTLLLTAIAQATRQIGLVTTASTTFYPPYILARQLQSLHWLSQGRAGWNIVTALGGHANFGLEQMPAPEDRYARAAEFTDLVRALWQSYPQSALMMEREGLFTDPAQIRPVDHRGTHFAVEGPLNIPEFAGDRIPLFQAGASEAGREFAARVSDGVFASTPDREAAVALRRDLQARAVEHGRSAADIRLLPGVSLYLAPTRAEAEDLFAATHAKASIAQRQAVVLNYLGLDLTDWPADRKITLADLPPPPANPRSRTHAGLLRRLIAREELTAAEILQRPEVMASGHWQIIGTPEDAASAIADWRDAGAIDGCIFTPGGSVSSMHLALSKLAPLLTEHGLLRDRYQGTTLINHLRESQFT